MLIIVLYDVSVWIHCSVGVCSVVLSEDVVEPLSWNMFFNEINRVLMSILYCIVIFWLFLVLYLEDLQ